MSEAQMNSLELILRLCQRAAPDPWYFRVHARETNTEVEAYIDLLELLWLEGLVEKAPGSPHTGPGVLLTEKGRKVLESPVLLDRLRREEPLDEQDAGAVVRHSLRKYDKPWATRLLLMANFAVFAWGAWLANKAGILSSYLSGMPKQVDALAYLGLLHQMGSVSAVDLVHGEWWRLITTTFIHGGILHIAMNMYTLNAVGGFVEQTWGKWRYLLIYFLAGWGGSCLAMAYTTKVPCVGASGALCGVLAAEGMWVLLYSRHLPTSMARRARNQMIMTIVLMVFISLMPGVSGWGHLGGAVAGAAAALVLHLQRFGPSLMRWLGIVALLPLPWLSWMYLDQVRQTSKEWQEIRGVVEEQDEKKQRQRFIEEYGDPIIKTFEQSEESFTLAATLLNKNAQFREKEEVAQALTQLLTDQKRLKELADLMNEADSYSSPPVNDVRQATLEFIEASLSVDSAALSHLREGKKWTRKESETWKQTWRKMESKQEAWREKWRKLQAEDRD